MKVNEITEGWLGQALGAFTRKSSKSQWSPPDIPAADLPNPDTTPVNQYGAWTAQATPASTITTTTPKVKPAKMSMGGQATASFGGGQSYQAAPAAPAADMPFTAGGKVFHPNNPDYAKMKQSLVSAGAWDHATGQPK